MMRALFIALAAGAAIAALTVSAPAQALNYAGCTAGFRRCYAVADYIEADGRAEEARQLRGECARASNECQARVRLSAANPTYASLFRYPRRSAIASISCGDSLMVRP